MPFDPEGSGYDYEGAKRAGLKPNASGHFPSRVPKTGLILKGRKHSTFGKTARAEKRLGLILRKGKGGRYFSNPPRRNPFKGVK